MVYLNKPRSSVIDSFDGALKFATGSEYLTKQQVVDKHNAGLDFYDKYVQPKLGVIEDPVSLSSSIAKANDPEQGTLASPDTGNGRSDSGSSILPVVILGGLLALWLMK